MSDSTDQMKVVLENYLAENNKFVGGNSSAGTRARKALAELGKLVKARRNEITAEKNARKASKAS
jgi:hypothetical protein